MLKPLPVQSTDCALLVLSCDPYADLWPPFFSLFHRHWPDCPFQVFLGAGLSSVAPGNIRMLRSSGGRDWSQCTLDYLDALDQRFVLIMLEDFFLRHPVPTAEVLQCLDFARAHEVTQLRLIPRPRPTDRLPGETNIGSCAKGSPYRLSTQAAIWDKRQLRALLRKNESIWEFELNGNRRADTHPDGFYSVWHSVLPYEGWFAHHVVEKGKWLPHEKWIFQRQNIGCDFTRRESLTLRQTLFHQSVQCTNWILGLLPLSLSIRIKKRLKAVLSPVMASQFSRLRGVTPPPPKRETP